MRVPKVIVFSFEWKYSREYNLFSSVVLYVLCDNNFRNYFSQIQNTQNKDIEIHIYYTLNNFDIKLYISEYYVFLIFLVSSLFLLANVSVTILKITSLRKAMTICKILVLWIASLRSQWRTGTMSIVRNRFLGFLLVKKVRYCKTAKRKFNRNGGVNEVRIYLFIIANHKAL